MSENELSRVLRRVYEQRKNEKTDLVEAIRLLFAQKGYDILFDYPQLKKYIWDMASASELERSRFAALYESGAMDGVKAATLDAYHYKSHFAIAEKALLSAGLDREAARRTLFILYDALGFPVDTPVENPQTLHQSDGWVYVGQVKNGKPHGRGVEELIIDGMVFDRREGLWIDGVPYGYFYFHETYGTEEYGFCVNGYLKGKDTHVAPSGEVFADDYD